MKKYYRLNQYITASTLRVIDDQGKQIGILPKGEAIAKANELGVDLVEVAPGANPPVCKLIDFKKFRFQEAKKEAEEKKKSKKTKVKEIRFSPFEGETMDFKLKRAAEFLADGNRVRISIFFRGAQMAKKDFGYRLIKTSLERLAGKAELENDPKLVGHRMEALLKPVVKRQRPELSTPEK